MAQVVFVVVGTIIDGDGWESSYISGVYATEDKARERITGLRLRQASGRELGPAKARYEVRAYGVDSNDWVMCPEHW